MESISSPDIRFAKRFGKTFRLNKADAIGLVCELAELGVHPNRGDRFAEGLAEQNLPSLLSSDLSMTTGSSDRKEFMQILYSLAWEGATDRYFFSREFGPSSLNIIDLWRDAMITVMEIGKKAWRLPYVNSLEDNMKSVRRLIAASLESQVELAWDAEYEEPTTEEDLELLNFRAR